jgi:hypothetical protein
MVIRFREMPGIAQMAGCCAGGNGHQVPLNSGNWHKWQAVVQVVMVIRFREIPGIGTNGRLLCRW